LPKALPQKPLRSKKPLDKLRRKPLDKKPLDKLPHNSLALWELVGLSCL
jgi:hypothetical protein